MLELIVEPFYLGSFKKSRFPLTINLACIPLIKEKNKPPDECLWALLMWRVKLVYKWPVTKLETVLLFLSALIRKSEFGLHSHKLMCKSLKWNTAFQSEGNSGARSVTGNTSLSVYSNNYPINRSTASDTGHIKLGTDLIPVTQSGWFQ